MADSVKMKSRRLRCTKKMEEKRRESKKKEKRNKVKQMEKRGRGKVRRERSTETGDDEEDEAGGVLTGGPLDAARCSLCLSASD